MFMWSAAEPLHPWTHGPPSLTHEIVDLYAPMTSEGTAVARDSHEDAVRARNSKEYKFLVIPARGAEV